MINFMFVGSLKFCLSLIPATGNFEIEEKGELVCSGCVYHRAGSLCTVDSLEETTPLSPSRQHERELKMDDVYKLLRLRGYEYRGKFKGILLAENRGERKNLKLLDVPQAFDILKKFKKC